MALHTNPIKSSTQPLTFYRPTIKSSTQPLTFYRPTMLHCNCEFDTVDRSIILQCYSVTKCWVLCYISCGTWYQWRRQDFISREAQHGHQVHQFPKLKKYKEWRRQDFISREDFPIAACRVAWYLVAVASPGFYLTENTSRAVSASISKTQRTKSPFAI